MTDPGLSLHEPVSGPESRDERYAILVEFAVRKGAEEAFEALICENACRSLADEPGCLVFDVCRRPGDPFNIVLYEIYADRAAFAAHLAAPHFRVFDAQCRALIDGKRVTELDLLLAESPR
ncbi:quinol monooxygenase YgiN [Chelatococcus caeni]|uniref:Quinol monooxygenase YgiN n=1 Tax=Chelatococcus caeni TaxID=1348468 RepID=A0A840C1Y6_9HYPH|nr:antibiotic biosynthesis monooxygenase [Chelatococcus caeni]MBB4017509.1 quinol monooxygenase YgiN [Chelatococcus caeni]